MKYLNYLTASAVAVLLVACSDMGSKTMEAPAEKAKAEASSQVDQAKKKPVKSKGNRAVVTRAIQNANRSDLDKADDEIRKTAKVLEFTGIKPGMTVLELEAGGGYYTEILSLMTGPKGKVIYQNPASFDSFLKPEDISARFGADGTRLPNVERRKSNFDDLSFADDNSVDVVTWFLGPHELWFANPEGLLDLGDPGKTYAEIFRVLKPGGKFIALDHKAAAGTPETSGGTTHRIDAAKVRERAVASGLKFVKASKVLANPSDDYDVMVFDPSVRRKTDRFLHMYGKPK